MNIIRETTETLRSMIRAAMEQAIAEGALKEAPLPQAAWLLGFRREKRELFNHFKEHGTLPILSKAADFDRTSPWFTAESRAYDVWALGAGLPAGLALTQGVIVI